MNQETEFPKAARLTLFVATVCVLLGRAWQGLFYDYPIREWLWDEDLMLSFLSTESFYNLTSDDGDVMISYAVIGIGLVLLCCLIGLLFKGKIQSISLVLSTVVLFVLALFYWKKHYLQAAGFLEYTLQWMTPLLLFYVLKNRIQKDAWIQLAVLGIGMTFFGHGAYALGWYPTPGHFLEMLMQGFSIDQGQALVFLRAAGWLDMIAVTFLLAGIFYKTKLAHILLIIGLWYCVLWGGATALARVVSHFSVEASSMTFMSWWWQTVLRMPHALIPLAVLFCLGRGQALRSGA